MTTTTKIIDMETVCNNIREITDQWKKMFDDEFFARLKNGSPQISNFRATTTANSSCPLLPDAAMPSLTVALCNGHAASSAATTIDAATVPPNL
jgi:hypothetical protein